MHDEPFAMVMANLVTTRELHSARPDAPVVPYVATPARGPRARRSRTAVAGLLHRAARAIEPAECGLAG